MKLYNYTFKNLSNDKLYATMAQSITGAIDQLKGKFGTIDHFDIYNEKTALVTYEGSTYLVRRA